MKDNNTKNELRKKYLQLRNSISDKIDNEKIFISFFSMKEYSESVNLLVYYPIKHEIDIRELISHAIKDGKNIFFPVCNKKDFSMAFKKIDSLSQLSIGAYNIMEPNDDCDEYMPNQHSDDSLIIVPGVVYDRNGFRVGYGKGYYDRFLPMFNGTKVGLAYSDFVIDSVPHDQYDRKLDILITEKEVIRIGK